MAGDYSRRRCRFGKVYNGGSIGSGTNMFYLMHPVTLSGVASESGTPTITVDTTKSFPCFVVGPKAPAVDEIYPCYMSPEGFWYAERMQPPITNPPTLTTCSSNTCTATIGIPFTLTFTIVNNGGTCAYFTSSYIPGVSGFVGPPTSVSDTLTYVPRASVPVWCPFSQSPGLTIGTWIGSGTYSAYDNVGNLTTGRFILRCLTTGGIAISCQNTAELAHADNEVGFYSPVTLGTSVSSCSPFLCQRNTTTTPGAIAHCSFTLTG